MSLFISNYLRIHTPFFYFDFLSRIELMYLEFFFFLSKLGIEKI